MLIQILTRGLKTGLALAATTTATIMLAGDNELHAPWAAINAIAHAVDGDDKEQPLEYSARESRMGILINGTAMAAWGVLYEGALVVTNTKSSPLTGALATVTAYVIDYKIVPKRFTPGIEKRLSLNAIALIYAVLGITFALSPIWNRKPAA